MHPCLRQAAEAPPSGKVRGPMRERQYILFPLKSYTSNQRSALLLSHSTVYRNSMKAWARAFATRGQAVFGLICASLTESHCVILCAGAHTLVPLDDPLSVS